MGGHKSRRCSVCAVYWPLDEEQYQPCPECEGNTWGSTHEPLLNAERMRVYSITQASAASAVTFVVGQLVAFVPSLSNSQQDLISIGTTVVAVGFLIANSIHAHGAKPVVPVAPVAAAPATVPVAAPAPAGAPPAVSTTV